MAALSGFLKRASEKANDVLQNLRLGDFKFNN